ncbi:DNA sulfur modification protein DndB [Shewanella decolorationis]|uniref:DNA sulfur modification protein DndB n=1 Tax=Shewanella decolorationis TaxID=256839 RepID=UPI00105725BA|nr:DNA sulfur modification protein DndB [Shewanella decolorationis]
MMKSFEQKDLFELKRTGTFGSFSAAGSFPVNYVLASFDVEDLKYLTFARELVNDKLDFEMMMQRDIDEDRAIRDLAEYLYPSNKNVDELKSNIVFFPPILVAILDVRNEKVSPFYPKQNVIENGGFIKANWGDLFQIKGFQSNTQKHATKLGEYLIQKSPVEIGLNIESNGSRLVVIDGQHRLYAIKEMLKSNKKELLNELHLPVCIVFPPHSTDEYSEQKVPSSTEVFRHLFVDVNATMEQVGGHFTILLKDNNVSSVVIRKLCDMIINEPEEGRVKLSAIEWNTKSKKDSTILTKKYSVTSIGIIDKALSETIGGSQRALKHVLDGNEDIDWEAFDLSKRTEFEEIIKETLVNRLYEFISGIDVFNVGFDIHSSLMRNMHEKMSGRDKMAPKYKIVYKAILNASPVHEDDEGIVDDIYSKFVFESQQERKKSNARLINYALFQRALFEVWYSLLTKLRNYYSAKDITKLAVWIINKALDGELDLFSLANNFCQYNIWQDGRIKGTEGTRKNMHDLIISLISGLDIKSMLLDNELHHDQIADVEKILFEFSEQSLNQYLSKYRENRIKAFKVEYPRYLNLNEDEIDELNQAKRDQDLSLENAKLGKIEKLSVNYIFDNLVMKYVSEEVESVIEELRSIIGFDFNVMS